MRIQCHFPPSAAIGRSAPRGLRAKRSGGGVQAPPQAVIQAAAPRTPQAKQPLARHSKLPGYAAVASGALLAMAGCASFDAKVVKAWTVEPVLNVVHSAQSSQAYYAMGRYYDGSQAWDKAIDAYRKSIAADAQNIEAYNALGVALAQSGHFAEAETTLRQAVALAPGLVHVRSNLGYVLTLAGKPGEGVIELKAAVKQDGSNAMARANLRDALAKSDASRYSTAATAAPSKKAEAVASAINPGAAVVTQSPTQDVDVSEGSLTMISVPAPVTSVEIPTPLSAAISVPRALQTASLPAPLQVAARVPATPTVVSVETPAPMTLRVVDSPTVQSLVERVTSTQGARSESAPNPRISAKALPEPGSKERVLRLEVSNGNGVAGMAARVGRWLATQGMPTDRLSNQPRFAQQQTVIQYRNGHEEAALRVARSLPANARAEAAPTENLRSDVRVVLGRDWVQTASCLDQNNCRPVANTVAVAAGR